MFCGFRKINDMSPKGETTRVLLLDAAEQAILQTGFCGLALPLLLKLCGLSKGAFFHHFTGRNALGLALLERHAARELRLLAAFQERAARKTADPVQRLLLYLGDIETNICADGASLIVHFAAERAGLDAATRRLLAKSLLLLHAQHARMFAAALPHANTSTKISAEDLSAMLMTLREGGNVPASAGIASHPLATFRIYVEAIFAPADKDPTH
ncbi:MAG: hypothetical protein RJB62_708 [Pseudomonadota bacterium]|jgi:TetR/AcrR family transcriptional repressor of nem operon